MIEPEPIPLERLAAIVTRLGIAEVVSAEPIPRLWVELLYPPSELFESACEPPDEVAPVSQKTSEFAPVRSPEAETVAEPPQMTPPFPSRSLMKFDKSAEIGAVEIGPKDK